MADLKQYSPTVLRIFLGLLFVLPGFSKVMGLATTGSHMVVGMLWGSVALAWLLGLVEVIAGLAVLVGWKVQYAAYPLIAIILGAIVLAVLPSDDPMMMVNLFFHLVAVAALLSVTWTGAGALAVEKSE